jgi:hypothetical protein
MIERYVNAQFKSTKIEERGEIADQSTRQAGRQEDLSLGAR